MSGLKVIAARAEILARLQGISQANGYLTNLGSTVQSGWPKHLILGLQIDPPVTAVHPQTESVDDTKGVDMLKSRTEIIELIASQHKTSPEWLDQALDDIRRALFRTHHVIDGVTSVTTGDAEWSELEDSGLVRLLLPVTIRYSDRYGA